MLFHLVAARIVDTPRCAALSSQNVSEGNQCLRSPPNAELQAISHHRGVLDHVATTGDLRGTIPPVDTLAGTAIARASDYVWEYSSTHSCNVIPIVDCVIAFEDAEFALLTSSASSVRVGISPIKCGIARWTASGQPTS